jgi:hypothetical protein
MKSIIKALVVTLTIAYGMNAIAQDRTAQQRIAELAAAIQELNAPQQPNSHIEHPGWHNPDVRAKLKAIIEKYPDTDEALTAQLWLAIAELEVGQAASRAKKIENMTAVAAAFAQVIKTSPDSWQAKVAHIGRSAALFGAKQWDDFRAEANNVLARITAFQTESDPGYLDFLRQHKTNNAEIEPELRWMMIVAAACEAKTTEAVNIAEALQSQFPEWSARRKVAGTIELLKSGKPAFGCW